MSKIAFVSDAIYPYNKGGKEKRLYDISTRLAKQGHQVTIYCMHWWPQSENIRVENGVTLHAICPLIPLYSGHRRSFLEAIFFALSCFKLMNKDFDSIEVDHMPFLPLYTVKLVCLLRGKPMQATWHEVWGKDYWHEYAGLSGLLGWWSEKFSVYLPDKINAVSQLTADRVRQDLHYKGKIEIVPNTVDTEEINSVKPASEKSDVIYAGRLLAHKNIDILLESVALIPSIKTIIIGEGPEKNKLVALAKKLKIQNRTKFYDFFPDHKSVYALMKSSKVFVLPSTREGFGISVLEAAACGLPTITIDHPDNATKDLDVPNLHTVSLSPTTLSSSITSIL